jgi:hypothetical protein
MMMIHCHHDMMMIIMIMIMVFDRDTTVRVGFTLTYVVT